MFARAKRITQPSDGQIMGDVGSGQPEFLLEILRQGAICACTDRYSPKTRSSAIICLAQGQRQHNADALPPLARKFGARRPATSTCQPFGWLRRDNQARRRFSIRALTRAQRPVRRSAAQRPSSSIVLHGSAPSPSVRFSTSRRKSNRRSANRSFVGSVYCHSCRRAAP